MYKSNRVRFDIETEADDDYHEAIEQSHIFNGDQQQQDANDIVIKNTSLRLSEVIL